MKANRFSRSCSELIDSQKAVDFSISTVDKGGFRFAEFRSQAMDKGVKEDLLSLAKSWTTFLNKFSKMFLVNLPVDSSPRSTVELILAEAGILLTTFDLQEADESAELDQAILDFKKEMAFAGKINVIPLEISIEDEPWCMPAIRKPKML